MYLQSKFAFQKTFKYYHHNDERYIHVYRAMLRRMGLIERIEEAKENKASVYLPRKYTKIFIRTHIYLYGKKPIFKKGGKGNGRKINSYFPYSKEDNGY